MAWCPVCKNEYRAGITKCADCGVDLVENLLDVDEILLTYGQERDLKVVLEFLEYNKLTSAEIRYNEKQGFYELYVSSEEGQKALALVNAVMQQKAKEAYDAIPEEEKKEIEQQKEAIRRNDVYQSSAEKADSNRASAYILIAVGLIGLIGMVIGISEITSFRLGNNYMFIGVMLAVFLLFLVSGLSSMKYSKVYEKNAESEKSLKASLLDWSKENLKKEIIDQGLDHSFSEEELYFKRFERIKFLLNGQFMNLDQSFLDQLIDNEIYDMLFND